MKRFLFILVIGLFNPIFSSAQNTPRERADQLYKQGEKSMLKKNYLEASRDFERAIKIDTSFVAAYRLLGTSYELMNDYDRAVKYYEETLMRDSMFSRALYYQLADAYYKTQRYVEALEYFQKYYALQSYSSDRFGFNGRFEEEMEERFRERLSGNIQAVQTTMDSLQVLDVKRIVNLGSGVNSKAEEIFPAITANQKFLYFTRYNNLADDDDLFISSHKDDRWSQGHPVNKFNTRAPEGYSYLMRDNRGMFLMVCKRKETDGPCDIWEAIVKDNEITGFQPIQGLINSSYWEGHASISCDGNTLFFSSNRPGGVGLRDIWKSERMENGYWGRPINLGRKINTTGNEVTPYLTDDGETLFFTSDDKGHPGLGNDDIFMSKKDPKTGEWSSPINVGPPINTGFHETAFFLSPNGRSGYFSSDRRGGLGGLDIYEFELEKNLSSDNLTFVEGYVIDSVMRTPIPGATVQLGSRPSVVSDEDGRFFVCAFANEWLDMTVTDQENYHPYNDHTLIPAWDNTTYYDLDLLLQPIRDLTPKAPLPSPNSDEVSKRRVEKIYEHSVYFSFDDFELTTQELNKLGDFIKQFEGKEITKSEVFGYADHTGPNIYNLRLSEERAKGVALFLVENGMTIDQIYMEGRGELENENAKSINRRVEIRVVIFE